MEELFRKLREEKGEGKREENDFKEELKDYFERLQISNEEIETFKNDKKTLFRLHQLHVQKIPFENLNISLSEPIETENIHKNYEKLTIRKRGGYCFEMNTIFYYILSKIGFKLQMRYATVTYRPNANPKTHIVIIAQLISPKTNEIKEYLCDVSFGGFGLYSPLPLILNKNFQQGNYFFHFTQSQFDYSLEFSFSVDTWNNDFGFNLSDDFVVSNFELINRYNQMNQYDQDAYFRNNVIISKVGEFERVYLFNNRLSIRYGEEVEIIQIVDQNHFKDIIFRYFNLSFDDQQISKIFSLVHRNSLQNN